MAYAWIATTPLTGSIAMFEIKELLVAQGWTVLASGDGDALYGAASDILTSGDGDGTPLVAGSFANPKAWFRIGHPDTVREFTIQHSTAGANDYQFRIKFSFAAGFTGGTPGISQTASAADEVVVKGGGTDAAPTMVTIWASANGSWRLKAGADDAAPHNMWAYGWANGAFTGVASGCLQIETLSQLQATDGDGTWIRASSANPLYSTLWSDSSIDAGYAFVAAAVPTTWTQCGAYVFYSDSAIVIPSSQTTNPITRDDDMFPIFFGRKGSAASPGFKGVSTQMKWGGVRRKVGETLSTVAGAQDRICVGDINLPWNGTDPSA